MTFFNDKIVVDVLSTVKDFYPGLTQTEYELLTESIVNEWDYSFIYDTIADKIEEYARLNNIILDDKDGVYTDKLPNLKIIQGGKT